MDVPIHIIYIPGLGDSYDTIRKIALRRWRSKDVEVTFVPMKWRDTYEALSEKQRRVRNVIKTIEAARIILVGESAGGSVVVAETFSADSQITKGITMFGKNVRADRVAASVYGHNPAFRDSMKAADKAVSKMSNSDGKRLTVLYSPFDPTIRYLDTVVPGAVMKKIRTPGHLLSIAIVLFVLKHKVINEAKKP